MTENDDAGSVEAAVEEPTHRAMTWYNDPATLRHRTITHLARLTGGRIRSPHHRSVQRFHRERDVLENEECRPSSDQRIRTWVLWATEAYTPAHVQRLLAALAALRPTQIGDDRDPEEWIRRQRGRPGSRLYMHFQRSGSSSRPLGFDTKMPDFADYCLGTLWSATPSLTMLTMTFFLAEQERGRFEALLRADHPTRLEPHGASSIGIHSPELERRRVIAETRADWRRQATGWFARSAPGLLNGTPGGFSTCELTVLHGLTPHPAPRCEPSDRRDARLLTALDLRASIVFAPGSAELSEAGETGGRGPFFAPYPSHDHSSARHASVSIEEHDFHAADASFWGDGESRHAHRFEEAFRDVPAQFAVNHVVDHFGDRVLASRDALATLVGRTRAGAALGRIRRDTAECADAATVARDIRAAAADGSLIRSDAGLVLRRNHSSDERPRLGASLRENLERTAGDLTRDVADLSSTLHAQASLLSAYANLRLQPWIVLLAILSMLAGLAAAIEPVRGFLRLASRPASSVARTNGSGRRDPAVVRPRQDPPVIEVRR